MVSNQELAAIVRQLQSATDQAQETIGKLARERSNFQHEIDQFRLQLEDNLRRAIVAELTLKRLVASINPNLSSEKFQKEIDRIIGETEDDRAGIQDALVQERKRSGAGDEQEKAIDELEW